MDYENKYKKYKTKYNNLKNKIELMNQLAGADGDQQIDKSIMSIILTGGIMGMNKKLEIFNDFNYKLIDKSKKIENKGKLNKQQISAVNYVINNAHLLKNLYSSEIRGSDFFYTSIQLDGNNFNINCDYGSGTRIQKLCDKEIMANIGVLTNFMK